LCLYHAAPKRVVLGPTVAINAIRKGRLQPHVLYIDPLPQATTGTAVTTVPYKLPYKCVFVCVCEGRHLCVYHAAFKRVVLGPTAAIGVIRKGILQPRVLRTGPLPQVITDTAITTRLLSVT